MKRGLIAVCMLLGLAACSDQQATATRTLDDAGNEVGSSWNKLRDMTGLGHQTSPEKTSKVQPRYCYQTYEDVICYSRPLPGEEYRMVGYQESSGKAGYLLPASVQPQAKQTVSAAPSPKSPLPVPTPKPAQDTKQLKEVIFDPAELEPHTLVPEKPE